MSNIETLRVRLALAMHKKLIAMGVGVSNLPWFSSRAFAQSERPQRDAAKADRAADRADDAVVNARVAYNATKDAP